MTIEKWMRVEVQNLYGPEWPNSEGWRIGLVKDGPAEGFRGRCWLVKVGGQDPLWFYEDEIRQPTIPDEMRMKPS